MGQWAENNYQQQQTGDVSRGGKLPREALWETGAQPPKGYHVKGSPTLEDKFQREKSTMK